MLSPEKLVRRARERGHHRQPGVGGFCRECYLAELEEAIAEGHPELDRGEVFELVQECLRLVATAAGVLSELNSSAAPRARSTCARPGGAGCPDPRSFPLWVSGGDPAP